MSGLFKSGSISEIAKNHYPEHYPPKENMPRIVIWHSFWKKEQKEKTFWKIIKVPLARELQIVVFGKSNRSIGNIFFLFLPHLKSLI